MDIRFGAGVALGCTFAGALIASCSFPEYKVGTLPLDGDLPETILDSGSDLSAPDSSTDGELPEIGDSLPAEGGGDVLTSCLDGGLTEGNSTPCTCPTGSLSGFAVCLPSGTLGTCVGCAPESSCDGVTLPTGMSCIPGGTFSLGAANAGACAPSGCPLEQPKFDVAVPRFFMDEREVTVGAFRVWWNGGHDKPAADAVILKTDAVTLTWQASWTVQEPMLANPTNQGTWRGAAIDTADLFRLNYVDWPTALAYCMALNKRLPTESEWEIAASGGNGRLYPWAAAATRDITAGAGGVPCSNANTSLSGKPCSPLSVGAKSGASPDAIYDLIGSVAEWALDIAPPGGKDCTTGCWPPAGRADFVRWGTTDTHAVRGGSFLDTSVNLLRSQSRDFQVAATQTATIGFRCVTR